MSDERDLGWRLPLIKIEAGPPSRTFYLSGDRTEALRQYERCAAALAAELGVKPGRRTVALHEQLQGDRLDGVGLLFDADESPPRPGSPTSFGPLQRILSQLTQMRGSLTAMQDQLQRQIQTVEHALDDQEGRSRLR